MLDQGEQVWASSPFPTPQPLLPALHPIHPHIPLPQSRLLLWAQPWCSELHFPWIERQPFAEGWHSSKATQWRDEQNTHLWRGNDTG